MPFKGFLEALELEFPIEKDDAVTNQVLHFSKLLTEIGQQVDPIILPYFQSPPLFHSLPSEITKNEQKMMLLIGNSSSFSNLVTEERKKLRESGSSDLFMTEIHIPETPLQNGKMRRAERGRKINIDFVKSKGIDPSKVLFFRRTQPSEIPKPEYYWTSDYFETQTGLTREISGENRKNSIILVATLEMISLNDGLIQDINDDCGLAVRQIGIGPFDQSLVLAQIKSNPAK